MTKFKPGAVLLVCALATVFTASPTSAQRPSSQTGVSTTSEIGFVRNTEAFDEAGCSLQFPEDSAKRNERYIFMSDFEDNAVINLDGKDVRLKLVNKKEPKGEPRKGDRSTYNYSARGTYVKVDMVVTRVCDPNDEECEVRYYDATITVRRGTSNQVVKATGLCGT